MLPDINDIDQLVRALVTEVATPQDFGRLPLEVKRQLQCIVVLRYLLAHGYAHGIDAVSRAVRVCKETHVGAGWFLNQRITHMLGTALAGTGLRPFSQESESTAVLLRACDRLIQSMVPGSEDLTDRDPYALDQSCDDDEQAEGEEEDPSIAITKITPKNELERAKKTLAIAYEVGFKEAQLEGADLFHSHVAALRRVRAQVARDRSEDAATALWSGRSDPGSIATEFLPLVDKFEDDPNALDSFLEAFAEYAAWRLYGDDDRLNSNYLMNLLCSGVDAATSRGMEAELDASIDNRAPCWGIVAFTWGVDPFSILPRAKRGTATLSQTLYRLNWAGVTGQL